MKEQDDVREFMLKAGQECPGKPTVPPVETMALRIRLIAEEFGELTEAMGDKSLVKVYDALLDLQVVVIGTAVAFGLDLDPGWAEVHRSNMSKFIDGHRRPDGKWMKGPSYSPADLWPIIQAQLKASDEASNPSASASSLGIGSAPSDPH